MAKAPEVVATIIAPVPTAAPPLEAETASQASSAPPTAPATASSPSTPSLRVDLANAKARRKAEEEAKVEAAFAIAGQEVQILLTRDESTPPVIQHYSWRDQKGAYKRGQIHRVPEYVAEALVMAGAATRLGGQSVKL